MQLKNNPELKIETHRTKQKITLEAGDPRSLERNIRQLLADKVCGNLTGIWLLIPEYLRLGAWDMLQAWCNTNEQQIEPRLALQLVNETALCVNGIRLKRTMSQRGFELANGLPFVAADSAIHNLLNNHTMKDAQTLQIALGKIRRTCGHFPAQILAVDPHRIKSYSQRQMIQRKKSDSDPKPAKMAQIFFCMDTQTQQPICFISASSARNVTRATEELLTMTADIINCPTEKPLVLADDEHFTVELLDWIKTNSCFDMLTPMPNNRRVRESMLKINETDFTSPWVGYAAAKQLYRLTRSKCEAYYQLVQRKGEKASDYDFKAFICTGDRDELEDLSLHYPQRWHIEEFFHNYQAMGWKRAGSMNLNIQYGKMTLALIAQAACYMLRQKIGDPYANWSAEHLANDFFRGLEGDIRVKDNVITVTYYNAPNADMLKSQYENLPKKLLAEYVNPKIPWLYDYMLDFKFK